MVEKRGSGWRRMGDHLVDIYVVALLGLVHPAPGQRSSFVSRHFRDALDEFHSAFDVEPFAALNPTDQLALIPLRATLIAEETREVAEAIEDVQRTPSDQHQAHLAKEVADLLYVTVGTAQLLGLPLVDPVTRPALSLRFLNGAAVVQRSMDAQGDLDELFGAMYRRCSPEIINDLLEDLTPTLQSLTDVLATFAAARGIPLRAVFDAVHASNMSKLDPDTQRPILREDGKVLKGKQYFEPDLRAVLRQPA